MERRLSLELGRRTALPGSHARPLDSATTTRGAVGSARECGSNPYRATSECTWRRAESWSNC